MKIKEIIAALEEFAPPQLQEAWDNTGLLTGDDAAECSGVLCTLDVSEAVLAEAVATGCNLIVAHHPVIFKGLKRLTGKTQVERTVLAALKANIAIYAAHTSLDNVAVGVNGAIAQALGLTNTTVLVPKADLLCKLETYVPQHAADTVRDALFAAGGGQLGNYSECAFTASGMGSFKANAGAQPFVGNLNERHYEPETKIELIFPAYRQHILVQALQAAHPYEEVAYHITALQNRHNQTGSGLIGRLPAPVSEVQFLKSLANIFKTPCIRHTPLKGKMIETVAMCGGSGAFLINDAARQGAQVYVTADVKYHEFFDAPANLLVADVGHYESEHLTIDLLHDLLVKKFPTFAVRKTTVNTNPVQYFV